MAVESNNWFRSLPPGLAVAMAVGASFLIVSSVYFAKLAGELREATGALKSDAAQLHVALTQSATGGPTGLVASVTPAPSEQPSDAPDALQEQLIVLQELRKEIGALAGAVGKVQRTLSGMSVRQAPVDPGVSLPPDFQPLPAPMAPKFGANPGGVLRWRNESSPEQREYVDSVMRESAKRAREKIQAQSSDPRRPDIEVISRIMQESEEEIASELRNGMPQEDFEALFPRELQQEMPASPATPR